MGYTDKSVKAGKIKVYLEPDWCEISLDEVERRFSMEEVKILIEALNMLQSKETDKYTKD